VNRLSVSVDAFVEQKDMKRLFGAEQYGRVNACAAEYGRKRGK
jgi:hypothetical protein